MSDSLKADLDAVFRGCTKGWKKAKQQEERVARQSLNRMRIRPGRVTIKDAAFNVMERAYMHASSGGKYYANARQIMYAARPLVLEITGGEIWKNSSYFTQTLLKDYLEDYSPNWKVVWDARGHINEPHTGRTVDLGGLAVMEYTRHWTDGSFDTAPVSSIPAQIDTKGPGLRYSAALFIEKEGFAPILQDAGIAERYDLAIMSTKGLPVAAACNLIESLHAAGVKILVCRDFDLAGFKIIRTLKTGVRLTRGTPIIDIGLRLEDVEGLQSEEVIYKQDCSPKHYLRQCGATEDEMDFLVQQRYYGSWSGERVELNAFTSEQFIDYLESKFAEHDVEKVVPDESTLANAYRRALFRIEEEKLSAKLAEEMPATDVPGDLEEAVRRHLEEEPGDSWDEAVCVIAEEANEEDE